MLWRCFCRCEPNRCLPPITAFKLLLGQKQAQIALQPRPRSLPCQMESRLDIREASRLYYGKSALHFMPEILNRVKELRSARGWTQEQLARAVGVSRQSINSIERDRYVPSLLLALTFAKVFGCSMDEIFTLNGDTQEEKKW